MRTDSDLTWKSTKKGEHEQSDGSTVSTGLTGIDGMVAQACYYTDMESGLTGGGELATLGTNRNHPINLHSPYGFCHTIINILGVETGDAGTSRPLSYWASRDGFRFRVNSQNVYTNNQATILWALNANTESDYPYHGGAIRTNGTWNNQTTTTEHEINKQHGSIGGITFLPSAVTWSIHEPGFYLFEIGWFCTAASQPVSDAEWLIYDNDNGEIVGGGQYLAPALLNTTSATRVSTILYVPTADKTYRVQVNFPTITLQFNLTLAVLIQKVQSIDSNPTDAST